MFTTLAVALHHFENVKGYLISATRASKYSTVAQWKIPHEGVHNYHSTLTNSYSNLY